MFSLLDNDIKTISIVYGITFKPIKLKRIEIMFFGDLTYCV